MLKCDEGKKGTLYGWNCNGNHRKCEHCGQSLCTYHFAVNKDGVKGGHSGCNGPSCQTSMATKHMCEGAATKCPGCDEYYCKYHKQQAGIGCVKGGHICRNHCSTSLHTRQNCSGAVKPCPHCGENYCEYHSHAVKSVSQSVGGHNCPNVTDGYWLAAGGDAATKAGLVAGAAGVAVLTAPASASGAMMTLGGLAAAKGAKDFIDADVCSTSTHYRHMCAGPSSKCEHCKDWYCKYHSLACNSALTDLVSGHCCSAATQGGFAVNSTQIIAENAAAVATAFAGGAEAYKNFGKVRDVQQTGIATFQAANITGEVSKLQSAKDVAKIAGAGYSFVSPVKSVSAEYSK